MKPFDQIIVLSLANQSQNQVLEHLFFKKLAKAGIRLTNYFGVTHAAQPNLLALVAGETCSMTNNLIYQAPFLQDTVVDILETKQVTWKSYVEDYPQQPWNASWERPYYNEKDIPLIVTPRKNSDEIPSYFRRNNVLASFHAIQKSEDRWNNIVDSSQFWSDIQQNMLPECVWYTPNVWNRGDFLSNSLNSPSSRAEIIPQQAQWLEHTFLGDHNGIGLNLDLDLLLENPQAAYEKSNIPKGTLLVITFDESDAENDQVNQLYTVLLGDMIQPNTAIDTPYNHYSLLKTIEENFQLGSLGKNDEHASWFRFLWDESFVWNTTTIDTQFGAKNALAITHENTGNHMVFSNETGDLFESFQSNLEWSQPSALGIFTDYKIALASLGETTFLMYQQPNKELLYLTYNTQTKEWSDHPILLGFPSRGAFDMISFIDTTTKEEKLMLCWIGSGKEIQYMIGTEHGFDHMIFKTGQRTDGSLQLGKLGTSLFLIYKELQSEKSRIISYNTADFNAYPAIDMQGNPAEESNYTCNYWSFCDFELRSTSENNSEGLRHLDLMALASAEGQLYLIHNKNQFDTTKAYISSFGFTGILTPQEAASNGYGTLKEVCWTKEKVLPQVSLQNSSSFALSSNNEIITLAWIDANSETIQVLEGGYHKNEKSVKK
jgi:hypothetical protein